MGGKSFKRAWSPEEIEKRLLKIKKEEEKKNKDLSQLFGGG